MSKYRKKPVVIEALQFTDTDTDTLLALAEFINQSGEPFRVSWESAPHIVIHTLEGDMSASIGDYIIRGVNGEFYPCKPDIFAKTYEQGRFMLDLKHDLLTSKYTKVSHEGHFQFNAPHYFEVASQETGDVLAQIHFQEGPIKENGINGVCNEDLLAMVICRLEGFQDSPFASRDNAMAIARIEEAMLWLRKRTVARESCGVEGTSTI